MTQIQQHCVDDHLGFLLTFSPAVCCIFIEVGSATLTVLKEAQTTSLVTLVTVTPVSLGFVPLGARSHTSARL